MELYDEFQIIECLDKCNCGFIPRVKHENNLYTASCKFCGEKESSSNTVSLMIQWNKAMRKNKQLNNKSKEVK
jgi:hypothetical protein